LGKCKRPSKVRVGQPTHKIGIHEFGNKSPTDRVWGEREQDAETIYKNRGVKEGAVGECSSRISGEKEDFLMGGIGGEGKSERWSSAAMDEQDRRIGL